MKVGITVTKSKTQMYINQAYINYIQEAGFEPVIINEHNKAGTMAKFCDCLLLPGGVDLEPTFYGENNIGSMSSDPERDDFERQILHAFIAEKKKVFGICRGFQLIVREFISEHAVKDTSFYQHINEHSLAAARDAKRSTPTHSVHANIGVMYGEGHHNNIFVNSMHHQAFLSTRVINDTFKNENTIKELATTRFGLKKGKEHIIEAVDVTINGCAIRAVQWHPEELRDINLLRTFFTENDKVLNYGKD